MAVIRATCDWCGDVELGTSDVMVRVPEGFAYGTYVFHCPCCGRPSVRDAAPRVVAVLATAGVRVVQWHLPAELREQHPLGAAFTSDDLLDFHELLADEHRFDLALSQLAHP